MNSEYVFSQSLVCPSVSVISNRLSKKTSVLQAIAFGDLIIKPVSSAKTTLIDFTDWSLTPKYALQQDLFRTSFSKHFFMLHFARKCAWNYRWRNRNRNRK